MAAALVARTVRAVTSTSQIVAGAYELSRKLLDFLKPPALRLDPDEVHCLFCIQRQIECLLRPLELCVACCRRRDSAVQQTVSMVEDTLRRVWQRISHLEQRSLKSSDLPNQQRSYGKTCDNSRGESFRQHWACSQQQGRRKRSNADLTAAQACSSFTVLSVERDCRNMSSVADGPTEDVDDNLWVTSPTDNKLVSTKGTSLFDTPASVKVTSLFDTPASVKVTSLFDTPASVKVTSLFDTPASVILRWCMEELSIAVSQLTLTLTTLQLAGGSLNRVPPTAEAADPGIISVATVLKASRRICSMSSRTGDVCLQAGSFYILDSRVNSVNSQTQATWKQVWSQCFLRVVKTWRQGLPMAVIALEAARLHPGSFQDQAVASKTASVNSGEHHIGQTQQLYRQQPESDFMMVSTDTLHPQSIPDSSLNDAPLSDRIDVPNIRFLTPPPHRLIFPGDVAQHMRLQQEGLGAVTLSCVKEAAEATEKSLGAAKGRLPNCLPNQTPLTGLESLLEPCSFHSPCLVWRVGMSGNVPIQLNPSAILLDTETWDLATYKWIITVMKEICDDSDTADSQRTHTLPSVPPLEVLYTARLNLLASSPCLGRHDGDKRMWESQEIPSGCEQPTQMDTRWSQDEQHASSECEDDSWRRVSDEILIELLKDSFMD